MFCTYQTLIAKNRAGGTRLDQLIDWCGGEEFDGLILLDECELFFTRLREVELACSPAPSHHGLVPRRLFSFLRPQGKSKGLTRIHGLILTDTTGDSFFLPTGQDDRARCRRQPQNDRPRHAREGQVVQIGDRRRQPPEPSPPRPRGVLLGDVREPPEESRLHGAPRPLGPGDGEPVGL